jgi:predicted TIM-barrel fold metal-dependent hydrolase
MGSPSQPRSVDAHVHVFTASAPSIAGARYRPAYEATLAALRATWSANGTTHGVLVQPSFFGTDNREMLAAVATDREHLRGVAVVDPTFDANVLGALTDAGAVALRWNLKGAGDYAPYASDEWRDLLERARKCGWHLECHVDIGRVPDIAPAIARTGIDVLFDHFASPGPDARSVDSTFDAIRTLSNSRAVGCKLSGPYRQQGAAVAALVQRWDAETGLAHCVWGSDWPWTAFEQSNDYRRLCALRDEWIAPSRRAAVLWDNAARLYRFA